MRFGLRPRIALLLAFALTVASASALQAGPADQLAVSTVLAAYARLRADHLTAVPSETLLRGAVLGMQRVLAMLPPQPRVRTSDVPNLLRPLDTLILRGQEEADLRAFQQHFLWAVYQAHPRITAADLAYAAIRGMAGAYRDPYTVFMSPKEFARFQARENDVPVGGIGAVIRLERLEQERAVIRSLAQDGPAARAGLRLGDVIVRIGGRSTLPLTETEIREALSGDAGTPVTVEIERQGAGALQFIVVRGMVSETPVRADLLDGMVVHLRLTHFSDRAAPTALGHLAELQARGARAVVLDLRGNGGGSVMAALMLASAFLERGTVVVTLPRSGKPVPYPVLPSRVRFRGPVAVLVDEETASAAEILAGALQDSGVQLIGRPTFGKGLIQSVVTLPDGSGLKYTSARYLTPKGRDINQKGLVPDVLLPADMAPEEWLRRAQEKLRDTLQRSSVLPLPHAA